MEYILSRKIFKLVLEITFFMILLISCYFFYMRDALDKFHRGATTVTKRSIELPYEYPSLTICTNPPFKPSVSKKYELEIPTRDLFISESDTTKKIFETKFMNKTMENLYRNFSYDGDVTFNYYGKELKSGINHVFGLLYDGSKSEYNFGYNKKISVMV